MIDLRCGDCLELMKDIPDNSIDMVLTSPPYDDLRKYNGNINQWNFEKFKLIAKELYRLLKNGGVIVWVVGDKTNNGSESGTSFKQALYFMKLGLKLHDTMIYEKNTSTFPARRSGNRYTQIFEYMFVFTKGKIKTSNLLCDKANKWGGVTTWGVSWNRGKDDKLHKTNKKTSIPRYSPRNNIWTYKIGRGENKGKGGQNKHPAVFPLDLAKDHIKTWSNENDIVLDCFMGSGTTGVACKQLNRKFIGMEIDENYFEIAKTRIEYVCNLPEEPKETTIFDFIGDDDE